MSIRAPLNCPRRQGASVTGLVWLLCCVSAGGWLLARSAAAPPAPAPARQTKPIEDVRAGDWVLAADEHDPAGPPVPCRVVDAPRNYTYHVVRVKVEGGGEHELRATRAHPFWVDGRGWTDAKDLRPGDALRDDQGRAVRVVSALVERQDDEVPTYNLTVDRRHTYYVDAAPGMPVLVHNVIVVTPGGVAVVVPPGAVSMDQAIEMATTHAGPGARMVTTPGGNYQFVGPASTNAAGQTVRNIGRLDVNLNDPHVQQYGPHVNREGQINGRPQPHLDPHTPIDQRTIRPGDCP